MRNSPANAANKVISSVLLEIDQNHSSYQNLYRKYYGQEDEMVKQLHKAMTELCMKIKKDLLNELK